MRPAALPSLEAVLQKPAVVSEKMEGVSPVLLLRGGTRFSLPFSPVRLSCSLCDRQVEGRASTRSPAQWGQGVRPSSPFGP